MPGQTSLLIQKQMSFCTKNRHGSIIKQHKLENCIFLFQQLLNNETLRLEWTNHPSFSDNHASAKSITSQCPLKPKTTIHLSNPESLYDEEFFAIQDLDVYH